MLGPTKPIPTVGARARIVYFGGGFQEGVIVQVSDGGRRVAVKDREGTVHEFVLGAATAQFAAAGEAHGPRLELL